MQQNHTNRSALPVQLGYLSISPETLMEYETASAQHQRCREAVARMGYPFGIVGIDATKEQNHRFLTMSTTVGALKTLGEAWAREMFRVSPEMFPLPPNLKHLNNSDYRDVVQHQGMLGAMTQQLDATKHLLRRASDEYDVWHHFATDEEKVQPQKDIEQIRKKLCCDAIEASTLQTRLTYNLSKYQPIDTVGFYLSLVPIMDDLHAAAAMLADPKYAAAGGALS